MQELKIESEGLDRSKIDDKREKSAVSFTRHSKASYKTYTKTLQSDNPLTSFNADEQITPDLPEAGVELAKNKAAEFFSGLPKDTVLFFASSNEARAIETANIYRTIAKKMGFDVIVPDKTKSELADNLSEGEIRVIDQLSINSENLVIDSLFTPASYRVAPNWNLINDDEFKKKFEQAAAIIDADNRGNWGANYAAHSQALKEIFPQIKSSKDLFGSQFKNLMRLAKFAADKIKEHEQETGKTVKVLAFGHENYMLEALEKYFDEEGLNNCEMVDFEIGTDNITAHYRGKSAKI